MALPKNILGKNKKVSLLMVLIGIIVAIAFVMVLALAVKNPANVDESINSFKQCADAGYPIQESFPERCVTPKGQVFINQ